MDKNTAFELGNLPWVHGGDIICRQLKTEGIEYIFTLTGGHVSGIFDGARFCKIKLIDFRHEQAAVHAADAFARLSKTIGVAVLTAGPGVTNGLTGIANAYYACSPVAVIGGRNPFALGTTGNLQDAPQLELSKPITKYSNAIYDVWRAPHIIREAFSNAKSSRFGPVYIDVPFDVQLTRLSSEMIPENRKVLQNQNAQPDLSLCREIADILQKSKKPLVIAGSGAYWNSASKNLDQFLRAFDIPVFLNGMARGLLGKTHPNQVLRARTKALKEADTIILLGVDLDFRFNYGNPLTVNSEAVLIQVDSDESCLGKFRDVNIGIECNIDTFLACINSVRSKSTRKPKKNTWLSTLKDSDEKSQARWIEANKLADYPIDPRRFVFEVASYLEEDTIVIGDGGDIVALFAEFFRPGNPGHWMDPGPFGCIGVGIPFAMGARLAEPQKPIVVISGDGAFGFNAMEIESAKRQGLPFVVIIGNDGAWGEMRTFHEDIFGPYDKSAQYLSQDTRYEDLAIALGGYGERVEKASDIVPAIQRAFASGLPAVLNVILDTKFRRESSTISGKHLAMSYSEGNPTAFMRDDKLIK